VIKGIFIPQYSREKKKENSDDDDDDEDKMMRRMWIVVVVLWGSEMRDGAAVECLKIKKNSLFN